MCEVDRNGGAVREMTALDGVEDFVVSPDESKLLVRHSDSYVPPQLAVVGRNGEGLAELTDTRTPAFKARTWIAPEYVQVPSKHGAGTIWGKYYGPKQLAARQAVSDRHVRARRRLPAERQRRVIRTTSASRCSISCSSIAATS